MKKSFSSGGAISSPGKTESKDHDSSKKKSSSTPSKNHKDKENKESKDKDKLNVWTHLFPSPSFLLPFIPYPTPFLLSSHLLFLKYCHRRVGIKLYANQHPRRNKESGRVLS